MSHGVVGVNARLHWAFEDPSAVQGTDEQKLAKFRQVRDLIEEKVMEWTADQA